MASSRGSEQQVAEARTYKTAAGGRDSLNLSDGTRIVLGPASELVVASTYSSGTGEREVSLTGEGYFDVVHSDARPFVIRAGSASVRDVGTIFSVRAVDSDVRVSVQEGSVVLQHRSQRGDSLMLNAGDVGTLRGTDLLAEAGHASPDDLAWMQGRLVFRDAALDIVGDALKRSLGVHLQVDDVALRSRRLTTELTGMAPVQIGRALALAVGGVEQVKGDTISIRTLPARR
jgi:transmembrane sensor